MNLNAVGIDVSKRKSTVSVLRPGGDVLMKPFDISHRTADFQTLADKLKALDGETRVVMECTGHYYEPVARELSQAGLFVSAVNPQIINKFQGQGNPLRKVKTDKADSVKIARFTETRKAGKTKETEKTEESAGSAKDRRCCECSRLSSASCRRGSRPCFQHRNAPKKKKNESVTHARAAACRPHT